LSLSVDIEGLVPIQDVVAVRDLVQQPSGRQFAIPFNQRPWVWKPRNLGDLWADLQQTCEKFFEWNTARGVFEERKPPTGNAHYFGAFVVYERDTNSYEVVDGQQRLTSVCMLAAVLRELAQGVSDRSEGDLKLRNGANGMVTALTAWLQSDPATGGLRLSLDSQYDELFRNYVVEPRSDVDRAAAYRQLGTSTQSQRAKIHIKEGFDALRKLVIDEIGDLPDAQLLEHIRTLERVLGDAFISTLIVVNDEPFALSVFGGLNARGVPLGASDQIKNELFERTPSQDHQQIKDDWDAIVASVPNGNIELFLRQRYLAFVDDDCPKSKLYFRVRDEELVPNNPKDIIAEWKRDANLLSVLTIQKGHPKVSGELVRQLRTLHETLGITYSWPLLLSAGRRFLSNDLDTFRKLVRLALAFCFRVLTVGKADVLDLERPLTHAAIGLTRGATPNAIARMLREANSDEEFEKAFAEVTLRRASVQFYALYEIETYRSKHSGLTLEPFPHSPHQNVEHILPQNLSKQASRITEWSSWRSASDPTVKAERHREYVNRLGNLLILEAEVNQAVSNFDFRAKQTGNYPGQWATDKGAPRKCYTDSTLKLTKDLCDQTKYSRWSAKAIEDRQAELALDAVNAWTLRLK
jgi:Protein of unknown function DUF262/Protein of unknown function (DUF1524)